MKTIKVMGYDEIGFDYAVCDEIFENGTGKDIDGRFLDIGFWKEVLERYITFEDEPDMIKNINKMVASIAKLDDDIHIEF